MLNNNMRDLQYALAQLLDANSRFALDARGTTNHCPMALVALARMGASGDRLQAFFDHWAATYAIVETEPAAPVDGDWLGQLGNAAAFSSLARHFGESIGARGAAAVIGEVLGRAPEAPATGAFHAIIRMAYGIEAGHAGEIAAGLAAYVATNLPIPIAWNGRQAARSVEDGLAGVSSRFAGAAWPPGSITGQLRAIAADPDFCSVLPAPPAGESVLDDMARAAIELYWQTPGFTILHMVTGMHAARVLFARLPAHSSNTLAQRMVPSTWAAFCAAYVSVGAPPLRAVAPPDSGAAWPEVLRLAAASDNDHVIKMADTCFQESLRDPGSPYYLAAAARLVRAARA
jgi:hypothetical protein